MRADIDALSSIYLFDARRETSGSSEIDLNFGRSSCMQRLRIETEPDVRINLAGLLRRRRFDSRWTPRPVDSACELLPGAPSASPSTRQQHQASSAEHDRGSHGGLRQHPDPETGRRIRRIHRTAVDRVEIELLKRRGRHGARTEIISRHFEGEPIGSPPLDGNLEPADAVPTRREGSGHEKEL